MVLFTGFSNRNQAGRPKLSDHEGKMEKAKLDTCARLLAAHHNGMEALPLFCGGVAVSVAAGVPVATMNMWAAVHVGTRLLFNVIYAAPPVANGLPRTMAWGASTASSVALWLAANSAL